MPDAGQEAWSLTVLSQSKWLIKKLHHIVVVSGGELSKQCLVGLANTFAQLEQSYQQVDM